MPYYSLVPKPSNEKLTLEVMSKAISLKVKLGARFNPQLNNETIDFDNVIGSQTIHQGARGGELEIEPLFELNRDPKDLDKLKKLESWYLNGTQLWVLYATDEKYANLIFGCKGHQSYIIVDVDVTEYHRGRHDLKLRLQKQTIFPPEVKSFTSWKPATKTTSTNSKSVAKSNPLITALAKCKLPLYENRLGKNKTSDCDLTWQEILRLFKFYITYNGKSLKLDGYFGFYTEDATKKFQRKYKIKVTGKCDTQTLKKIKQLILASIKKEVTVQYPKSVGGVQIIR
ncbi:putative peptidoglycan binding domain protein [Methanobrevibacter cuticularis]|uniref:Putative peptidoglycan binding domain protein n=1 Tax=Methanobrevibacter cuticularis TaxID=47311 RepID=A0A166EH90_9EURY|nr:peptidoglycan-binding domain-containing protein [Methanobrevibacter cuticularis]KZX16652.1 putative peptidoglycan binding domain protein [Methanobrevibacter cuticularis]